MSTLQSMRVVLAIAEKGSLTLAATALDTSLPTVVRVLAAAERHLGVRLFERTTRQVRLTEEGALYVESCRLVLNEIETIEDTLRDRRTELVGRITVTAPVMFGRMHVVPLVNDFLREHQQVSARVILLDRVVDLVEEGIDVAVRIGQVENPDLVATHVASVRRCLCVAPALLKEYEETATLGDLVQFPFVQNFSLMPSHTLTINDEGKPVVLKIPNVRLETNSIDTALAACIDGLGIGVFLSYQVQEALALGQLVLVLPRHEMPSLPVSLVYLPTRRVSARTRAFIAYAKQYISRRLS